MPGGHPYEAEMDRRQDEANKRREIAIRNNHHLRIAKHALREIAESTILSAEQLKWIAAEACARIAKEG